MEILLCDEQFKDQTSVIIDEMCTFFLAGSATTAIVTTNTIMYLLTNLECYHKVINEMKDVFGTQELSSIDLHKELTIEQMDKL